MARKNIYFILASLFFLTSTAVMSYPWPISPFNIQHQINGTLGEWKPRRYFHQGVDIRAGINTNVYPVVSGVVRRVVVTPRDNNDYVRVEADGRYYDYFHITPMVQEDQYVIEGRTILGRVNAANHLHFEEDDGAYNPLRSNGLTPYTDNHLPEIKPNSIQFVRERTEESIGTSNLNGRVDILVDTTDRRTGTEGSGVDLTNEVRDIWN